jgi:hypothetical protein
MIRIDTGFYIFDRQIITFFYKKKYSVKNRFIRLIRVLITLLKLKINKVTGLLPAGICNAQNKTA